MQAKNSDILDRLTILRMKKRFDKSVEAEYKELEQETFSKIIPAGGTEVFLLLLDLMESNAKVWENEASIRKEIPTDPSNTSVDDTALSEIGRRTILIRAHNRLRLQAKAGIDKIFGQPSDVKVDHASQ